MSPLVFLAIAFALTVLGATVVWLHGRTKTRSHGVLTTNDIRRSLDALSRDRLDPPSGVGRVDASPPGDPRPARKAQPDAGDDRAVS